MAGTAIGLVRSATQMGQPIRIAGAAALLAGLLVPAASAAASQYVALGG